MVAQAAQGGTLPEELAAHVAECPVCAEALLVASFLKEDAGEMEVPAAGLVYWRAELRARREQAERALRPMRAMEMAAMVLLCLLAVGLGVVSGSMALPLIGGGFAALMGVAGWVVKTYLLGDSRQRMSRMR